MSQSTVTPSSTTARAATGLTAGRRRRRAQLDSEDSRSPSPEHFIDLTVDSPIATRQRKQSSTSKIDSSSNNAANSNDTIVIEDTDSPPIRSPPRPARQKRTNRVAGNSVSSVGGSASSSATATSSSTGINSVPDVIELKDHEKKNKVEKCKTQTEEQDTAAISCPICFEELLNSSLKAMSTKCGHIFCENCLKNVLSTKKKCPVCMAVVSLKSCIRLHL